MTRTLALTLVAALICLVALNGVVGTSQRFDGFSVVRLKVRSLEQRQALADLIEKNEASLWSPNSFSLHSEKLMEVDVMATQSTLQTLRQFQFASDSNDFTVLMDDVQKVIDEQHASSLRKSAAGWFEEYHPLDVILRWVRELAGNNTKLVTYHQSIGRSVEGRDLVAVSLHGSGAATKGPVPQIILIGGQHAREWVSHTTVQYVFEKLVSGYGTDPDITTLLNAVNITIIPVMNPDGYVYTWTGNRLWRKNRRLNPDRSYGVDLNRNWDAHWGGEGSSHVPSSDIYCGSAPFSEPETAAMANLYNRLTNVKATMDVHSYSQLILRPFGWTHQPCPDEALLSQVGDKMSALIKGVHNMRYVSESVADLYVSSGGSLDWFYDKGTVLSYAMELRDTGRYGFLLPPEQIIPTGEEVWEALKYLFQFAATN